jgi:hypothetical protein
MRAAVSSQRPMSKINTLGAAIASLVQTPEVKTVSSIRSCVFGAEYG